MLWTKLKCGRDVRLYTAWELPWNCLSGYSFDWRQTQLLVDVQGWLWDAAQSVHTTCLVLNWAFATDASPLTVLCTAQRAASTSNHWNSMQNLPGVWASLWCEGQLQKKYSLLPGPVPKNLPSLRLFGLTWEGYLTFCCDQSSISPIYRCFPSAIAEVLAVWLPPLLPCMKLRPGDPKEWMYSARRMMK